MNALALLVLVTSVFAAAPAPARDAAALTALLERFLAGASRNDPAIHERFWADDLIYTGSSGRRIGKADILRDVRSAPAPLPADPATRYGAEEIRIQQYGEVALVAFRLVATATWPDSARTEHYFNTGTFVKRRGEWRAVGWQATKIPPAPRP